MGNRVIDLRPGKRTNRKPVQGQEPLFAARQPKADAPRKSAPRPKPLRARKRRARIISVFLALALLGGAAWDVSAASYMPRFSVQTISVAGGSSALDQEVQQYAWSIIRDGSHHYFSRANILFYPHAIIARDIIADFPLVQSATVARPAPLSTEVDITLTQRQDFALWCSSMPTGSPAPAIPPSNCYEMDQSGFIFSPAQGSPATSQYVFEGGLLGSATSSASQATSTPAAPSPTLSPIGQSFVPAHLPGIVALLTQLGQAGFAPQGAVVENATDFEVPLSSGFFIKASFGEDPSTLVSNLGLILSSSALQGKQSDLEYVDLRFGDRVYYKLAGQAAASSTTH